MIATVAVTSAPPLAAQDGPDCPAERPLPVGFEVIRLATIRDSFQLPRWALFFLPDPAFIGLGIFLALHGLAPWHRAAALASVVVLVVGGLWRPKPRLTAHALVRMLAHATIIGLSGGLRSPVYPFVLLLVVTVPILRDQRRAFVAAALALLLTWGLVVLRSPGDELAAMVLYAACMSSLIVGALFIGMWLRGLSDLMLRRSLEARDEALHDHVERVRELTTFAAQIAHELKNPLASIKGLGALMELEPERAAERLVVLRREADRMQSVLEEFLNFSRPLAPLAVEDVRLGDLVTDVADLHAGLATEKRLAIDTGAPPDLRVRADGRKVKQVLVNLVQNAIDASPVGGTITLRVEPREEGVCLRVTDEGAGVPPERLRRLVEPGVTTKPNGSGLGLTIVRALVEQHAGVLTLANREGGGFVATVELPAQCPTQGDAMV